MNETVKKNLTLAGVVVFLVVFVTMMIFGGIDHIEDTNGPEDFSLQTITDQQIVDLSIGSVGGPNIGRNSLLGSTVEFYSDKFTGVYEILYDNFILPSDFVLSLYNFEIRGGNFKLVIVHDDKIVAELEPGMTVDYRLENVTGAVSLRIVGESASFRFDMTEFDYDFHSHAD